MRTLTRTGAAVCCMAGFPHALSATPAESAELESLRTQVQALEQQIQVLARQIETRQAAEAQAAKVAEAAPKVTVNDQGVSLASADGANSLRIRGRLQLDGRQFFNEQGVTNDGFVLRRARLVIEGTFAKDYSVELVTEFAGSTVTMLDANLGIALGKSLQLKIGKFKSPVGLELLQSDSGTFFNERSLVTNLVPNRDLGIQASGVGFNGTVNCIVGIFNGAPDGASTTNPDFDNEKEGVARVMFSPFQHDDGSLLQGLSLGLSGSSGREKSTAGRTAGYKTDGQQTFFAYNAAVVAEGRSWRVSPQFDYRHGAFGAIGEYVISSVNVRPGLTGPKAELSNHACQLAAGYVLTGEDSAYTGVVPRTNFNFAAGTWGAFEVVGRFANLKVDDAAFPLFATLARNADEASSSGLGLNWYLSKVVAFRLDYSQTEFGFNAAAPAIPIPPILRQAEQVLISRFQVSF